MTDIFRNEADHNGLTVFVQDLTTISDPGLIIAFTKNYSVAELSDFSIPIKGLEGTIYYFHRIKVRLEFEGTGEGKALMIEICKVVDEHKITIYNQLNPYGGRDMESLKSFFRASGFQKFVNEYGDKNVMIRKPQ